MVATNLYHILYQKAHLGIPIQLSEWTLHKPIRQMRFQTSYALDRLVIQLFSTAKNGAQQSTGFLSMPKTIPTP